VISVWLITWNYDFAVGCNDRSFHLLFGVMRYYPLDLDSEAKVSGSAKKRFGPPPGWCHNPLSS